MMLPPRFWPYPHTKVNIFCSARVPELHSRPHFNRCEGTRSLPPLFIPSCRPRSSLSFFPRSLPRPALPTAVRLTGARVQGHFFIRPGKPFWAILGGPGVIPGGPLCPPLVIGTKLRPSTPPSLQPSTLPPFPSLHPSTRPSLYPIHPFTPSDICTTCLICITLDPGHEILQDNRRIWHRGLHVPVKKK